MCFAISTFIYLKYRREEAESWDLTTRPVLFLSYIAQEAFSS